MRFPFQNKWYALEFPRPYRDSVLSWSGCPYICYWVKWVKHEKWEHVRACTHRHTDALKEVKLFKVCFAGRGVKVLRGQWTSTVKTALHLPRRVHSLKEKCDLQLEWPCGLWCLATASSGWAGRGHRGQGFCLWSCVLHIFSVLFCQNSDKAPQTLSSDTSLDASYWNLYPKTSILIIQGRLLYLFSWGVRASVLALHFSCPDGHKECRSRHCPIQQSKIPKVWKHSQPFSTHINYSDLWPLQSAPGAARYIEGRWSVYRFYLHHTAFCLELRGDSSLSSLPILMASSSALSASSAKWANTVEERPLLAIFAPLSMTHGLPASFHTHTHTHKINNLKGGNVYNCIIISK